MKFEEKGDHIPRCVIIGRAPQASGSVFAFEGISYAAAEEVLGEAGKRPVAAVLCVKLVHPVRFLAAVRPRSSGDKLPMNEVKAKQDKAG